MTFTSALLVFTLLTISLATPAQAAGIPGTINLQGRLTDAGGSVVPDGVYTVALKIYADSVGGSALWSETRPVQVSGGLFIVLAGTDIPIPQSIFADSPNRYLGVTVNLNPEMPRIPLSAIAYGYHSLHADGSSLALNLTCVGCVSAGEIAADAVGAAEIASGAVSGGAGGDIADNTITADDLAANSVGSSELASSSVASAEISTGAVGTSEVADGGLTVVDIADEPGVASNTRSDTLPLNSSGVHTLLSRTINTPAPGYVFVIGTLEARVFHAVSGSHAEFGVSTTSGVFPENQTVVLQIHPGADDGPYAHPVTVHGLFSTPGGSDTFYLLGRDGDPNYWVLDNLQLTLLYFPTSYGTVVETGVASGVEISSLQNDDVSAASNATISGPIEAQSTSQTDFHQELLALKAEMAARIQQLEEAYGQSKRSADQ